MAGYSNLRALRALVRASLQSIARSPSAIVFSIAFPLVFILVFGFLGSRSNQRISIALASGSDTSSALIAALRQHPGLKWVQAGSEAELQKALADGSIAATLKLRPGSPAAVQLHAAPAHQAQLPQLQAIVREAAQQQDPEIARRTREVVQISADTAQVRELKTIDFILPGQLGFSLLAGSIFGTAFVFFSLRQTLVLKRFFATPVRREVIILSEGLARMLFQLITSVIIILAGHYVFGFTLIHGFTTVLWLLALSMLGVMVFMGFGFMISGIARSEATIPPLANIVTMPQFLLAGTFFPVEDFPRWLQPISRMMPLTYLNDAMRRVSFEGAGFWEIRFDLLVLLIWGVVAYVAAAKLFKWE
jgi:ABC-2 type transport system permease protein